MIDWNDSYYHKCEFCKHRGPTTELNAWILEWTLLFMAMLFDKIDDLSENDK